MMKLNNKYIWLFVHIIAILIAIFTLICNLVPIIPSCCCNRLCGVAGVIGVLYLFFPIWNFFFNRPRFDWYIVKGNYLLKVVALVLLFPSIITGLFLILDKHDIKYSPKDLFCENSLYPTDKASASQTPAGPTIYWTVYSHFMDPGNQHMSSHKGRAWSALIAIFGVFLLNGLLVSSIIAWIDSRKEKWLKGEVEYPCFLRWKKHYVIIGGNDIVTGIVKQIISKKKYILIQTSNDVESLRCELNSNLTEEQQKRIIIFYGSRTSEEDLKKLYLQQAIEVYILGEQTRKDEFESYHDTINMQCFDLINKIAQSFKGLKDLKDPIKCYVMFEYQTSFAAFQSSHQQRIVKTKEGNDLLAFIPFSPYESWAQTVLVNGKITLPDNNTDNTPKTNNNIDEDNTPITYNNIDEEGISYESDKIVHIIIVGMSKMGTAMAIETAHLAHFPNFVRDNSKRTKITFIDKNAREESDFFMGRFSDLFKLCKWTDVDGNVHNCDAPTCDEYNYFAQNFIDIEWEFRSGGVESKENREYIESCFKDDSREIVTIAICLPWPHQSLAAALYLPKVAIHKANDIWVYQPLSGELLIDINKSDKNTEYIWNKATYRKLKPFGMLSMGFDATLLDNDAIAYCSEFYNAKDALVKEFEELSKKENTCIWNYWNRKNVEEAVSKIKLSLGKLWEIWSNIYQINTIEFKMRSLGQDFAKLDEPDIKELFAKVEHNRWIVEKLLMGYRPLEDHTLNTEEIGIVKEYLKKEKVKEEELAIIQAGINEKDIYYDYKANCFRVKKIKKFYKDGPMKIHPNICPFEWLPMDDKNYDICFTLAMPFLREKMKNKS